MKNRLLAAAANIGVVFLLGAGIAAQAAEVKVLSSYSMRSVMNEVGPKFERATGHKLAITIDTPKKIAKRIQDGETADVVIMAASVIAGLQVAPGSVTPVARSLIGVAVPKGAPKPDIASPEAVKRMLLATKSVAISHDGLPGHHLRELFERWGITDEMKPKIVTGQHVGGLDAQLFVHVMSSMVLWKTTDIIGPLPDELQPSSIQSAAIIAGAADAGAAKALIDFLRTPEAVAVLKAKGLGSPKL